MIILPKTTPDVGELLSSSHKSEKQEARNILKIIISSVRFLARQDLALRGHDEANSNLVQLIRLRAEDNPLLGKWLERSCRKFTSHENQNEFLEVMSYMVLRKLLGDIHNSPYLMVMVDETTDVANKEQLTFVIRWVDESLDVHEEFLGLYNLSSTTADSIVASIKDILLHFEIPAAKLRGQCYDGCSTMAGARGGVATKMQEIEPRAVFTHCYGHALNLSERILSRGLLL